MGAAKSFLDTSVLLHLLSADPARADCAEREVSAGGVLSVQVLNEFASVASRKLRMTFAEIREVLLAVRAVCTVVPLDEDSHEGGLQIAETYRLSLYDATIVASAIAAGCTTLVTEDLQHAQVFEGRLKVRNPFR